LRAFAKRPRRNGIPAPAFTRCYCRTGSQEPAFGDFVFAT
jgi:hypothetical protein